MIANEMILPEQYKDHNLTGDYKGFRECHIAPDWLLVYQVNNNELVLILSRTGSHSILSKTKIKALCRMAVAHKETLQNL